MWPLFCSEVGLSYEQEEKLRNFQKVLLASKDSWLDRHTGYASANVMQSSHDAVQAITNRFGQKERSKMSILSDEQKTRFLAWSNNNRERIKRTRPRINRKSSNCDEMYETNTTQHDAVNLYVVNHRLQKVLKKIPEGHAPLVQGIMLKKLSRRPSFESLGSNLEKDNEMSREDSCASLGSLKRSASEMSIDGVEGEDKAASQGVNPVEAQTAFVAYVEKELAYVKDIMPPPPTPFPIRAATLPFPAPTPVSAMQGAVMPLPSAPITKHTRVNSFLPAHLNVVPEEMWPADAADDFLMKLVEEDWAIGAGIDMELMGE
jgi:hypothetical protein